MTKIIYALVDPRDSEICYVGVSNDPNKRLWQHVQEAKRGNGREKGKWIRELLALKLQPRVRFLEYAEKDAFTKEREWICKIDNESPRLTNTRKVKPPTQYVHINIAVYPETRAKVNLLKAQIEMSQGESITTDELINMMLESTSIEMLAMALRSNYSGVAQR